MKHWESSCFSKASNPHPGRYLVMNSSHLVLLQCLLSFSSFSHSTGKVEAHLHTCFRNTQKALLGKGSLISSHPFSVLKWNKHWSEVKHGCLKRKNILLFLAGKMCKRRVQQNTHTQSHCDLCNRRCLSHLSCCRHSHSDTLTALSTSPSRDSE